MKTHDSKDKGRTGWSAGKFVHFSLSGKEPSWSEVRPALFAGADGKRQSPLLTAILLPSTVGHSEHWIWGLGMNSSQSSPEAQMETFLNVMNRTKIPSEIRKHK